MHFKLETFLICLWFVGKPVVGSSQPCGAIGDCTSVSDNIGYVACINSKCQCRLANGFMGYATAASKCTCPFQVATWNNDIYCLKLNQTFQAQKAYQEANKQAIISLYSDIRYPQIEVSMANLLNNRLPAYIADDAKGRANPVGDFGGIKGLTEYFYATVYATGMKISQIHFPYLVAEGDKVSYRVDLLFTNPTFPNPTNLTQTGRMVFNNQSQIISLELTNMHLGYLLDGTSNHTLRVQAICGVAMFYCTGTNTQYTSYGDCAAFLDSIPEGSWNRANSNTVVCRHFHSWLTTIDPDMHCSHIGPSGGGACIDFSYESYYQHNY
jgi:hypothetical protein